MQCSLTQRPWCHSRPCGTTAPAASHSVKTRSLLLLRDTKTEKHTIGNGPRAFFFLILCPPQDVTRPATAHPVVFSHCPHPLSEAAPTAPRPHSLSCNPPIHITRQVKGYAAHHLAGTMTSHFIWTLLVFRARLY